MFHYRMYGLLVESELELEAGYPVEAGESDVLVRMIRNEETMPELHIVDRDYGVVRLVDETLFWIKSGNEIIMKANEHTDWLKALQYLVTECLPAILFQRGIFTIHGSCVEYNNEALVITGFSGSGKSSLASEFLNSGCRLIADDTVGIDIASDGIYATPAFPQRKLVGDMVDKLGLNRDELIDLREEIPKYALNLGDNYCSEPKKFRALVQVYKYPGDKVVINEITGAAKLKFLMETSYEYMLYANSRLQKKDIEDMVKICNAVEFYAVLRPENGYTTEKQMNAIISKLL